MASRIAVRFAVLMSLLLAACGGPPLQTLTEGVVAISYDVPTGEATIKLVGAVTRETRVSGSGAVDVRVPAGSYGVWASAVEETGTAPGTISVFVPTLSADEANVVAGGRTVVGLAYSLGAVRPDSWVRLGAAEAGSIVHVTHSQLEFDDPPAAVLAMQVGDVLYLPPGVLPQAVETAAMNAESTDARPECGIVDKGSYVVFLGGGSQGRRFLMDYIPASLADLFVLVVDVRATCTLSGTLNIAWPIVGDFVSTGIALDRLTVDVRFSGQEVFGNPLRPDQDIEMLAIQSAACIVDPTTVLCRKWFVVTELDIDLSADNVEPILSLSPSTSVDRVLSMTLFAVPFGPLPLRANFGVDLELALEATLLQVGFGGPLRIRYSYTNAIGDGVRGVGGDEQSLTWDPSFRVIKPNLDAGEGIEASTSVGVHPFVSVSDPLRIAEAFVRAGVKGAAVVSIGVDPFIVESGWPSWFDASILFRAGVRYRYGGSYHSNWPPFEFQFDPFWIFANSKVHFQNAARVSDAFRVEYREVGAAQWIEPQALGWTYGLLIPGRPYDVSLTPIGDTTASLSSDCPNASGGTNMTFNAPGPKEVCRVRVEVDGIAQPADGLAGWWSFDACSARDESFFGNDGVVSGSPACVAGASRNALAFNGTTDYITVDRDEAFLPPTNFTIVAWINTAGVEVNHDVIVSTLDTPNMGGYQLHHSTTGLWFLFRDGATQVEWSAPFLSSYVDAWTMIAGVYERVGEATSIRIYINGDLKTSASTPRQITYDGPNNLRIGANPHTGFDRTRLFRGSIEEVLVYSRALSAQEIALMHEQTMR
jgi:hypothetical protein